MCSFNRIANLSRSEADRVAWLSIGAVTLLKLFILTTSPLLLSGDEAHYWEWSRTLELSYYSKGPLIAWLIALSTAFLGDTAFAVRLPALICATAFYTLLFSFLVNRIRPGAAVAVLLLSLTSPFFHGLGIGMNTDPPCVLLTLFAFVQVYRALFEEKSAAWIGVGLAIGVGALAKFTILIFVPTVFLILLLTPDYRRHFANPYLWIGAVLGTLCLLPVLIWNMQHGWVNVAHNAGHVVSSDGFVFSFDHIGDLLGGQILFLGPVAAALLLRPLAILFGKRRPLTKAESVFLWLSLPLLILCLLASSVRAVYANWPLPAYVSLLLAAGFMMNDGTGYGVFQARLLRSALFSGAAILLVVYPLFFGFTYGINPKKLISKKLVGWDQIGAEVGRHLAAFPPDKQPFLTTERYDDLSAITFYTPHQPRGVQWIVGARRLSQYDFWTDWKALSGRDAIIVTKDAPLSSEYRNQFASIEQLSGPTPVLLGGKVVREFSVFLGRSFDGKEPGRPRAF